MSILPSTYWSALVIILFGLTSRATGQTTATTTDHLYDWELVENLDPTKDTVRQLYTKITNSDRCDFPVIDGKMTAREFRKKYWNKSPVIVRQAANDWPGAKKWTKDYLIDNFGTIRTQIGTSTGIIRNGGQGNEYIDFGDYVENVWGEHSCSREHPKWCGPHVNNFSSYEEEKYLFDRENFMQQARSRGIGRDMKFPAFFRASEVASESYAKQSNERAKMLGGGDGGQSGGEGQGQGQGEQGGGGGGEGQGQGQGGQGGSDQGSRTEQSISTVYMFLTPKYDRLVGVGIHQHTDGWNAQVGGNGSKLWFVYPPQMRPGPEHPVTREWCCGEDSWVRVIFPDLLSDKTRGPGNQKPLMCTQQTGDLVYIPEWWHHGTLSGPGPSGESGLVGVASQLVEPSGELRYLYEARSLLRSLQRQQGPPQQQQQQQQQPGPSQQQQQEAGDMSPAAELEKKEKTANIMKHGRQLYRNHIQMGTITSYVSQSELLQNLMMELYELAENATAKSTITKLEAYQEAVSLAEKALTYEPDSGNTHAHASKLALWRNATTESLYHIRSGTFFFIFIFIFNFFVC